MNIQWSKSANKQLRSLSLESQKRIKHKLEYYFLEENPLVFAKHMVGKKPPHFRFRIGKYRIVGIVHDNYFQVLKCAHRSEIYD